MLDTFVNDLPKLPDELNVNEYDPTLLEIEPDWNKFVGESISQVILTFKNYYAYFIQLKHS